MSLDTDLPLVFEEAVATKPPHDASDANVSDDLLFYLQRGSELLQSQKLEDARQALERAHQIAPTSPKAQNLLGLAYFKLGLLEAAKSIYDKMVEQFPKEPTLFVNLGLVLLRQGRLAEAERALKQATGLAPDHVRAHCYLGLVQYRRGDLAAAREHFLKGHADEFAKKVDQKLARSGGLPAPSADLIRTVAESGFADLESSMIPFKPVDMSRDERVVRDEDAWEAMVTHEAPLSTARAEPAYVPGKGAGPIPPADAKPSPLSASPAPVTAPPPPVREWPEAVLYAEAGSAPGSGPTLRSIDALKADPPGFYAGPTGPTTRARLLLAGRACLRSSAIVAARGELSLAPAMSKLQGRSTGVPFGDPDDPMCLVEGRADLTLSVSGLAVAVRGVRDLHVTEARLVGFDRGFDWDNGRVLGMEVISLRGLGSVLFEIAGAPIVLPVEADQSVFAAGDALLGWSDGVRPSPVESEVRGGPFFRLRGRGYVLVAFPAHRHPNRVEGAVR